MSDIIRHILIVLLPLIFANCMHMLIVKYNRLDKLCIPISARYFGENKTWRGFVFVPLMNALILILINFIFQLQLKNATFLGILLGAAYMLFELPNSFLKRRLGIQSGQQHAKFKILFSFLDKTDSAFGVTLVYFLFGYLDVLTAVLLFVVNSITHVLISQLLVELKIKKSF